MNQHFYEGNGLDGSSLIKPTYGRFYILIQFSFFLSNSQFNSQFERQTREGGPENPPLNLTLEEGKKSLSSSRKFFVFLSKKNFRKIIFLPLKILEKKTGIVYPPGGYVGGLTRCLLGLKSKNRKKNGQIVKSQRFTYPVFGYVKR